MDGFLVPLSLKEFPFLEDHLWGSLFQPRNFKKVVAIFFECRDLSAMPIGARETP